MEPHIIGKLRVRLNPWDERALGYPVSEVLDPSTLDQESLATLERFNIEHGVGLCLVRAPSDRQDIKRDLVERDFRLVEHSIRLKILSRDLRHESDVRLIRADQEDLPGIRQIAASSFRYGRFQEDPWVDPEACARRYENWATDLVSSGDTWVVRSAAREIMGFMSWRPGDDGSVDLLLGGISTACRGFGPHFFRAAFRHAATFGPVVQTLISGANLQILQIYVQAGFRPVESLFGYHRHYR